MKGTKNNIRVAAAQFETKSGNKGYNLSVIKTLSKKAKGQKADVVCFHEMCITGYTFLKDLNPKQCVELAEEIPEGPSVNELTQIAKENEIVILAGLVEKEADHLFNTFVCVGGSGLIAKHRKLHPFINACLSPGDQYTVFEINGWKCGILICYDNNIIENVRATTLEGAEIIFAPHVTMCAPSPFPGSGYVHKDLWDNRYDDPDALRREFDGPKGREWLMRWLPARAYDNAVYYVFSNPVGMEGDHLKNGNSLVLDPFGEVITEIKSFEDEIAITDCTSDKLTIAGGYRYKNARRPELFGKILSSPNSGNVLPPWLKSFKTDEK